MKNLIFIVYLIAVLANLFRIFSFIIFFWPVGLKIFCYFTYLSLIGDTVYLSGLIYFKAKDLSSPDYSKDNVYYSFLINHLYKYVAITTWSVCIGFWGFVLLGEEFMQFGTDINGILWTCYVHFVITVIIWADAFVTSRKFIENIKVDIAVWLVGNIGYSLVIFVCKSNGFTVYPYLNIINGNQNIVLTVVNCFIAIVGYILFKNVIKKINKSDVNEVETGIETLI